MNVKNKMFWLWSLEQCSVNKIFIEQNTPEVKVKAYILCMSHHNSLNVRISETEER